MRARSETLFDRERLVCEYPAAVSQFFEALDKLAASHEFPADGQTPEGLVTFCADHVSDALRALPLLRRDLYALPHNSEICNSFGKAWRRRHRCGSLGIILTADHVGQPREMLS